MDKHITNRTEFHGYVNGVRQMSVLRNTRRFQHAGSKWVLRRCAPGQPEVDDNFQSAEGALETAKKLNPKCEWQREN